MTDNIIIAVDGFGGNKTREGFPSDRALNAMRIAGLDNVKYELTLPMGHERIGENGIMSVPCVSFDDSIRHLMQSGNPVVTAFNTQEGYKHFIRNRIPGIRRPILAAELPKERKGTFLHADVGANSGMYVANDPPKKPDLNDEEAVMQWFNLYESKFRPSVQYKERAREMVQFARLSSLYMELLYGIRKPRVGLQNIGEEKKKGNDFVQLCHEQLQREDLNYVGFAEPDDVDNLEVLVTDGFSGNLDIKWCEKIVKILKSHSKRSVSSTKLDLMKFVTSFFKPRQIIDVSRYSSSLILGLRNLIMLKIHGAAKVRDFAAAYRRAHLFKERDLCEKIRATYERRYGAETSPA